MNALFQPSLLPILITWPVVVTWSLQVVVLVAAGAIAAFAITSPRARLLMWQGLLLLLLLLPVIEPWQSPPAELALLATTVSVRSISTVAPPATFQWRSEDWLWIIAAGAVLRLTWVAAGFLRLRRYRQQATPFAAPPLRFASDAASWYASESVPGPVTYGWKRPVILLPARVLDLPADLREAIQCHELIHVRRGDWLFVLVEALVRSLLWFHPAIWFVMGRIQLSREQVVDREAVGLLRNRERYLDALVAVAEYRLQPDLAPAPLFLRKRHLAARVEAVVKEINMSRSRIVAGATVVCSALPLAACAAMWLFPFMSQAQTAPDSLGVTVDAGAALLHRTPVQFPFRATAAGTVILQATVDAKGEVSDAHVVSGPDELRKDALSSVLQWHYKPGPTLAQITIRFEASATNAAEPPAVPVLAPNRIGAVGGIVAAGGGRSGASPTAANPTFTAPTAPLAPPTFPATIRSISFAGVDAAAEQELRTRLPFRMGDVASQADVQNLRSAVQAFDGHLTLGYSLAGAPGSSDLNIRVNVRPGSLAAVSVPLTQAGTSGDPQRVSSNIQATKLIKKVTPAYPAIAKSARVQGTVTLDATIGTDGSVQQLVVADATSPLLVQSAMDAVKQWVYMPTLLNGMPTEVLTTINVNFSLQ